MKTLRNFQAEAIKDTFERIEAGIKSGLIVFATGLGKTLTAANIINKFTGRTLWITHTEELIFQSAEAIIKEEEFFSKELMSEIENKNGIINALKAIEIADLFKDSIVGDDLIKLKNHIGIIKQESFNINAKIVVASIQTLWRRLDKIPKDHFDLIVVDEAHQAMAKTWVKALEHFTPRLRLGLTATPKRLDGLALIELFEEIFANRDIKFGVDEGYLVEIDAVRIKTELSLDDVRTTAGELNQGDLEKTINIPRRNQLIVDSYKKYLDGKQVIVSCVDVQHTRDLAAKFTENGIVASFVVGDEKICPDRKQRISLFKSGEIKVMCHVNVLTMGFDHDMVEGVIQARPTKSITVYLQQIGRGTRPVTGIINGLETAEERKAAIKSSAKPQLLILDIVDNTSRHSLINAWTLEKDKPVEERTFVSEEKKLKMIDEREKRARKAKIKHKVVQDQRVNLFALPEVKVYNSGKNLEPASEAQLLWLQRLGYDTKDTYYSKFQASTIISELPASKTQLEELVLWNYDISKGVTKGAYSAAKQERERKQQTSIAIGKIKERLPFLNID